MKKTIGSILVVCFAIVAYGFTPNNAFVQSDNAAVVDRDTGLCGMPGSDTDGNIILGGIGDVTLELENNNKVMITCKGADITNNSGKAQHFEGFGCGLTSPKTGDAYFTTNSQATVAKNGNATLKCTFTLD